MDPFVSDSNDILSGLSALGPHQPLYVPINSPKSTACLSQVHLTYTLTCCNPKRKQQAKDRITCYQISDVSLFDVTVLSRDLCLEGKGTFLVHMHFCKYNYGLVSMVIRNMRHGRCVVGFKAVKVSASP